MTRQRRHRRGHPGRQTASQLFGLHAVEAALFNPARKIHKLYATRNAAERLSAAIAGRNLTPEIVDPKFIARLSGHDAVHQGVLLEADPLAVSDLADVTGDRPVVVLDQVTDPQNVGAIVRSCAAFRAEALIMTARHSPPLTGTLAKAASGGLECVPIVLVANLARALAELGERGFYRIGLDGAADRRIEQLERSGPLALVLGGEGKGLRRLTRENCDLLCRIVIAPSLSSLNVSAAAAIALYVANSVCSAPDAATGPEEAPLAR